MSKNILTPDEYIQQIDTPDRQAAVAQLRQILLEHLPDGFAEGMAYGMIGYAVPHSIYPAGYHCDTKQPLPFVSLAATKNALSLYHMGIYAMPDLMAWFVAEYPKHCKTKLDMGKSCIRFKKMEDIPYALLTELAQKVTVAQWIEVYERELKR
jgi:hypothetical protein